MAPTGAAIVLVLGIIMLPLILGGCPRRDASRDAVLPPARTDKPARQARSQRYIRIGVLLPLTGAERLFGLSMQEGIDLALQAVNAAGGVREQKLLVVYGDTRGEAEVARAEVEKLLEANPPGCLICGAPGEEVEAIAEMAEAQAVPMVIAASAGADATSAADGSVRPHIFSLCATLELQVRALAYCAADELAAQRVSIIWDESSDSSRYLKTVILHEFAMHHPEVEVADAPRSGDAADAYEPLMERLNEQSPDTLILLADGSAAIEILQAIRDAGIEANLLGPHRLWRESLLRSAADAAEGLTVVTHFAPDKPAEAVKAFVTEYRRAYRETPDQFAALAFDAVGIVVDAMMRAKSVSPEALAAALAQTKEYPGVTGEVTFDTGHKADRRVVVARVEEGELHFVRAIEVSELSANRPSERMEPDED